MTLKIFHTLRNLGLMPRPTEASMFVLSVTILALTFLSREMWSEIFYAMSGKDGWKSLLVFIYIAVGIYFSIFHAFSRREKTNFENQTLKWFLGMTMALIAISTSVYVFNTKEFGYLIFGIWNALQAVLLFAFSGNKYPGEFIDLPSRNAKLLEILLGILVITIMLSLNEIFFHQHWAIALSSILVVWSIVGSYFEDREAGKVALS